VTRTRLVALLRPSGGDEDPAYVRLQCGPRLPSHQTPVLAACSARAPPSARGRARGGAVLSRDAPPLRSASRVFVGAATMAYTEKATRTLQAWKALCAQYAKECANGALPRRCCWAGDGGVGAARRAAGAAARPVCRCLLPQVPPLPPQLPPIWARRRHSARSHRSCRIQFIRCRRFAAACAGNRKRTRARESTHAAARLAFSFPRAPPLLTASAPPLVSCLPFLQSPWRCGPWGRRRTRTGSARSASSSRT
jgi:hypothetical protein